MRKTSSALLNVFVLAAMSGISSFGGTVKIDGKFMDWSSVPVLATDAVDGAKPCDWVSVRAVKSDGRIYFHYECAVDVDFSEGAAYNIFIDVDSSRKTGYRGGGDDFPVGADYLLQGATLFKYGGEGTDWYWHEPRALIHEVANRKVEVEVSAADLGDPASIDFFLYADNEAEGVGGSGTDVCPDKAIKAGGKGKKLTLRLR
ncbi:MAG: hypothetical protein KJ626_04615 [Verrucomicrobia bacterium]|nr:hypothetical protein [Verrucomicrobiota bacterium]